MTFADIVAVLALIAYAKAGWSVQATESHQAGRNPVVYLQVRYDGTGTYGREEWTGRKWLLSPHMTPTEIVNTAFKAVLAAEEHETRELFTYKGAQTHGPHFDVNQLANLITANRLLHDVRADAMSGA